MTGERQALVNKIIPFSSVDGPGNRTSVFLQGCNFNCIYCHNPETISLCTSCKKCIDVCPVGALSFENNSIVWNDSLCKECDSCIKVCPNCSSPRTKRLSPSQVLAEIKKNIPYIRGVTISGGECTLRRDFLVELLSLTKEFSLETFLDSNGSYDFEKDRTLLSLVDGVMLDIKAFDEKKHQKITGKDNKMVLRNAIFLIKENKLEEIRTVISPSLFDAKEEVENICKFVSQNKAKDLRYKLIKYRHFGVRKVYAEKLSQPNDELMQELAKIAVSYSLKPVIL